MRNSSGNGGCGPGRFQPRAQLDDQIEQTLALFRRYGEQYNFDPLMLAAQGYQESRLDQGAKSHVGAIGVMQIMPATGAELKVGDIKVTIGPTRAGQFRVTKARRDGADGCTADAGHPPSRDQGRALRDGLRGPGAAPRRPERRG